MRNWIKYLIVTIIVALLTNSGQFYLWYLHTDKMKTDYENEIEILSSTLEDIGELVDVYSVRTVVTPGKNVKMEDLEKKQIPVSLITDSYAQEPLDVENKLYKVSVKPGTLLTDDILMEEEMDDTVRDLDIIADTWTIGLQEGDYFDYEITYPYGEKFIVLSHIRVESINDNTIKTYLDGKERHIYNGALVDYFLHRGDGATVNLVKYIEPGVQEPAKLTYSIPDNILSIITEDPNIVKKINTQLNMEKRGIIKKIIENVNPDSSELSELSSGRNQIMSSINGASSTFYSELEKELEEKERQAEEESYKKQNSTDEQSNSQDELSIGEGVVE